MTFRTLGDALSDALAKGMVIGEAGVGAPALRRKNAEAVAPASFRETLPAKEGHANRCMTTAFPNELPRSAVVIHLVVDNSGRSPAGRSDEAPAYRARYGRRGRAREFLKLVVG